MVLYLGASILGVIGIALLVVRSIRKRLDDRAA